MIDAFVYVHITGGAASILAGFVALFARKGEGLHRTAGGAFFVAMFLMCASAFVAAVARGQTINIHVSVTTLYLVATAWATVQRRDGQIGRFEAVALLAALAIGASAVLTAASEAASAPFLYAIAVLTGLSAVFDFSVIIRRGVAGAQRIARHLWRMTFALFVATGSYFLGQPKFVPAVLTQTGLNVVPVIVVIAMLVFWLVRVLLTRWHRSAPAT